MNPATGPRIRTGSDRGLRTQTKPTASRGDPDPALEKRKIWCFGISKTRVKEKYHVPRYIAKASTHF